MTSVILAACGATSAGSQAPAEPSSSVALASASSSSPASGTVVCEYYSTIDLDPSRTDPSAPDLGNPPDEDSPNELIAQAFGADLAAEAGLPNAGDPALLLRQTVDTLEDMASRADEEEREDIVGLAERLDQMALTGDLSGLLDATEGFYIKYADECGAALLD
jgi:hypothetical protein